MLRISTKKNRSFALLELLITVTIIGILAGIVLVAMGSARERGKDTKITSDMLRVQSLAEGFYLDDGDYGNVDPALSPEIAILENDIIVQGGSSLIIEKPDSPAYKYCAYADLNATFYSKPLAFCVDYQLTAKKTIFPGATCRQRELMSNPPNPLSDPFKYDCYQCPGCYDYNEDGIMNGDDAMYFLGQCNYVMVPSESKPECDRYDHDCSGRIDTGDVWTIFSFLSGIPCP